jgi:DNA polymerase-3 subunit gamma/tau
MSYQVLARKWRPQRFEEVVGQSHIIQSLINCIERKEVGHAYLFTGTRGVGKTTVARLFAKALRCENLQKNGNPCNECISCTEMHSGNSLNVSEIDGASNNSVDNIRQIVENVQYLPTSGSYKIYIIDEVHMLSTSAFNALLKTLEEPPEHVIFMFATTEAEKLLGTVQSRCQRFDFREIVLSDLICFVKEIAEKENISFESDKLISDICIQGRGSARDTLSLLDQVLSYSDGTNITESVLVQALGLARGSAIKEMVSSILVGNDSECVNNFKNLLVENVSVENILRSVLDYLFECINYIDDEKKLVDDSIINSGDLSDISSEELFWIYENISRDATWVLSSITPHKACEVILRKISLRRTFFEKSEPKKKTEIRQLVDEVAIIQKEIPKKIDSIIVSQKEVEICHEKEIQVKQEIKEEEVIVKEYSKDWTGFLNYLMKASPALASNLEQGNILSPIELDMDNLDVNIGYSNASKVFHDYLQEDESRNKLLKFLAYFYEIKATDVSLKFILVNDEEKIESQFMSIAEIEEKENENRISEKRNEMKENPLLIEAQNMFGASLDRVVVKRK